MLSLVRSFVNIIGMRLGIQLIVLLLAHLNFGVAQDIDISPGNMLINPYDHKLKQLNIDQIVEYNIYRYSKVSTHDTVGKLHLVYVINYDSVGRVSSFKYNFKKHNGDSVFTILRSPEIEISTKIDSSRLLRFNMTDEVVTYNFYEKVYRYDRNGLLAINIRNPIYYRGYIDGVFMPVTHLKETRTETKNKNGETIKVEHHIDDRLTTTEEYYYQEFTYNNYKTRLLTKVISTSENRVVERHLKYTFR